MTTHLQSESAAADKVRPRLKVLVVDDYAPIAEMLEQAVQAFGYDVRACHDGRSALEIAPEFRPDVILLDIAMPGLDGLEVCRNLRANPDMAGVKIIAQTGRGEKEFKKLTASAGFDLHLVKPVDLMVLEDMLSLLKPRSA